MTHDLRRMVAAATAQLEAAGVPGAARDAMWLLDMADPAAADTLTDPQRERYMAAVARRVRREPMSHILGRRAFWMHDFHVTADVLDPRPETETLVRAAIDAPPDAVADPARWPRLPEADWPPVPFKRVLDLGTGSGCVLVSLLHEVPGATGLGVDLSAAALRVAERNATMAEVAARAAFLQSDWLHDVEGSFDLIVSNPPYIAEAEMADLSPEVLHEPPMALTPGGDGLDAYRIIARDAPAHLAPGGRLMVEIGPTQASAVTALFQRAGLTEIVVHDDLDGRNRVVSGEKLV